MKNNINKEVSHATPCMFCGDMQPQNKIGSKYICNSCAKDLSYVVKKNKAIIIGE